MINLLESSLALLKLPLAIYAFPMICHCLCSHNANKALQVVNTVPTGTVYFFESDLGWIDASIQQIVCV